MWTARVCLLVQILLAVVILSVITIRPPVAVCEDTRPELQELLKELDSSDPWRRFRARRCLADMGPEVGSAASKLIERLAHDDSYSVYEQSRGLWGRASLSEAEVLGRIGQTVLAEVTAGLRDERVNVRMGCAMALNYMGEASTPSAGSLVERIENDPDSRVRTLALYTLRHVKCPNTETVNVAARCLEDPDQAARVQAAETLGSFGRFAHKAVPSLCSSLSKAEDDPFRVVIARALGRIGSADAVSHLIEVINRRLPIRNTFRGREAAIQALGMIGEGAKPALPVLLDILSRRDFDATFFRSAAWAIEQIDPETSRHVDLLLKATQDGNSVVRENAQETIQELCEAHLLKNEQRANKVPREEERNKPQGDAGGRTTDGK